VGEGAPRWAGWARLLLGVALLVVGAVVFLASRGGIGAATTAVLAVLVALAGLLVVAGPWLYRLVRELADERAERIRSQERADVAAHVHDSVLQTLTLIQRRSDDPREVVRLARAEERALRQWLYQPAAERSDSVSVALDRLAAEVEDDHGATLDVVCVGDASVDERLEALLQAAREAMVNAAKYAAAEGPVSVYAEVEPDEVSVYVRDRGPGFELAAIPADRMGVRESIIGRGERAGGRAEVRTAPGEGCEVRLSMPRGEEAP
jgi:signal transduction histidine kinase